MSPGGRYESWQQNQHETKRRKLDEGGFPTSQDVSLERMLFNQLLALTVWLFLKKKTGGTQQAIAEESGQMDLDPDGSTDPGPSGSPHPSRNIS